VGRTIPEEVSALRLRWAAAILLALLGTTMLVAPYHFDEGPLAIFRLHLVWWGSGFLAAAVALFAAATLGPPRWLAITSQLGAAGVVLAFAVPLLAGGGAGLTVINYLLLGVTLAAAALVPADDLATLRGRQPRETMDVFVLLCAASALATGCVLILAPTRIAPTIELARFPRLPVMAVVLVDSGLVLGLSQTRVPIPRRILTAICCSRERCSW
jgi:hypothetical protein